MTYPIIAEQVTELEWGSATPPRIVIFAKVPFVADGGIPVLAGTKEAGRARVDEPCTFVDPATDRRVVIPEISTLPATTNSSRPDTAEYQAWLYSQGADRASQWTEYSVFSAGFRLDHTNPATTWEQIEIFTSGPATPPPDLLGIYSAANYRHLNLLMEPLAVLPRQTLGVGGTYAIPADTYRVAYSMWFVAMGHGEPLGPTPGRYDLRDPSNPLTLSDVTVTGLFDDSHVLLGDPTLPVYPDPAGTYYERLTQLRLLRTRFRGIPTAAATAFNLFGAYGAIVLAVANYDTPYFILEQGDGAWVNGWNEMGDLPMFAADRTLRDADGNPSPTGYPAFRNPPGNGVFRFGTRIDLPLSKYHMRGIRIGPGSPETPAVGAGGGMTWVNLPASWGKVPDTKTYLFRDDCMGAVLDTLKWNAHNATDETLQLHPLYQWMHFKKAAAGWGQQGVRGAVSFPRTQGRVMEFDIVARDNTTVLVGWMDDSGAVAETNFAHGIVFETNANQRATIFEDGVVRGLTAVGTVADDCIYHVRITLQSGGGAVYEIQGKNFAQLGGSAWTNITPGTSASADNTLRPAIFLSTGEAFVNDVRVY